MSALFRPYAHRAWSPARDFPTLTPEEPPSAAAAKGNDCDQAEDEDDT
jgi:hypothetical protein